jgi:membrane protein DedA with SNARE-associated domain
MHVSLVGLVSGASYIGILLSSIVLPTEAVAPLAGYYAAQGQLSLLGVILCATTGSCVGSTLIYMIARLAKEENLYKAVAKYGRYLGIGDRDLRRADSWFDRHAVITVTAGRILPSIRSVISIPAGLRRMPFTLFIICTFCGTALWTAGLAMLGYTLHDAYKSIQTLLFTANILVLVLLIGVAAFFLQRRASRR